MATAMRMVARDAAKCRSGRAFDRVVAKRTARPDCRGGKSSRLFGREKCKAEKNDRHVMVPTSVGPPFEMIESQLALQILVGSLRTPSLFQSANDFLG